MAIADRPQDDREQRQRHRFLILTGLVMSCGGFFWGFLALAIGIPPFIPWGYTVITAFNLTWLSRTKNFPAARNLQVVISPLLPFLFQWQLGGFVSSGAVMIWAMLAVVCTFSFEGPAQASTGSGSTWG